MKDQLLTVALAQISPIWLDKTATIKKIENSITEAASKKAELIVFGESLLPGYPFWVSLTDGAKFDSMIQKEIHAHYAQNSIVIENGDLDTICELAADRKSVV